MIKYLLIILLFCSCYGERKARQQFGKSVTAYPFLGSDFCALTYPVKERIAKGDTVTVTDTVVLSGRVITDTVISINMDTIRITKTVQLPGSVITRTVTVHDTAYLENTAALAACRLSEAGVVRLHEAERLERVKYQARSRKYLYGLIGAGALIGLWLFFFIRKRVKK